MAGIVGIGQSGMDDGAAGGQTGVDTMVVGDDQVQPKLGGVLGWFESADAAVNGDNQFCALVGEFGDGLAIEAITFLNAVRNVAVDIGIGQL